jgi:DNA polymerase III alpha subunit (gram-positive type)
MEYKNHIKELLMISAVTSSINYNATKTEQLEAIKKTHQESQEKMHVQMLLQVQSSVQMKSQESGFEVQYQEFKDFLSDIGYTGKPIASLSQDEAKELVSEEGFFGIKETSQRIADFVILGSGGDEKLLRAGREGAIEGFKQAEKMWGGKLPEIAYETIEKTLGKIDNALMENGFSVLDTKA